MANRSPNPNNRSHISAQGGTRNDGAEHDSANEMWDIYLDEVKEDDKRISDAWKDDSNGILVFTGLFAATVGAFILESYKTLSPDSGNQTVALLGQISQQLANFPNGTLSITADQPFSPSPSMIWVNAMWLISLVLSLTSALIATLLQQWARRYVEPPHRPGKPNHRARVRSFLFHGTERYRMRFAVQIAPTLLHFSVYLFFAGLVVLFHTINKKVAIAVDVAVGIFAVAYIVLSVLPCLDVSCPYRTPLSYILWYPLHVILSFAALCLRWFVGLLHGLLVKPSLDDAMTPIQRILVGWLESRKKSIRTHRQYITDGLGKSIINRAINTQEDGDRKIVTRLFSLLTIGDKSKLRKFAASIPRDNVFKLIPFIESGRIVLRDSLLSLLQSCAPSTRKAEPDEDMRQSSLLVCLDAIHYIAKTPNVPELDFVRAKYANTRLMRALWEENDTAIRFTSRSICALLARQVVRGTLEAEQIRWLHDVTGEAGAIFDAGVVMRDRMNLKSFVYGVFSKPVHDLPTESFKESLAILLDVKIDAHFDTNFRNRLIEEVGWIQRQDPQGSPEVVNQLRMIFRFLPPPVPAAAVPPHYAVPLVNPHSHLVSPPSSDVTVPLPLPCLKRSAWGVIA